MSGQQRLLDVIDDPNALESFLGGLTSDSELLSSGETVDNVVASLARSLASDYEDSPLFDNIDNPTSNNLTDISQSYVPSDFENCTSNLGSESYFNAFTQSDSNPPTNTTTSTTDHQQQHFNSSLSSSTTAATTTQFAVSTGSNSICDSTSNINSSSTVSTNFTQQQNISLSDNGSSTSSVSSFSSILNNSSNFNTTQQQQQQLNQQESSSSNLVLSSTTSSASLISNSPSLPSTISNTIGSNNSASNTSVVGVSLSDSSSIIQQQLNSSAQIQQVILHQQQQQQQQTDSSTIQISNNNNISINSSNLNLNNNLTTTLLSNQQQNSSNITLSSIIPNNINSIRRTSLTINEGDQQGQQQQQQFQIIQGQNTSNATGQPQLMQIQTVTGSSQQFIQQNPTFITSGGSGLTLVATGNGGAYTVVPTGTQYLVQQQGNTLVQQQLKTTGGFFQQQTPAGSIVTTTQNQGPQQILIRAKQPQILPKPILASTNTNIISTTPQKISTASIVTSNPNNNSIMSTSSTNNSGAVLQQLQQQQQNTIVSSGGEGVTLSTQQIGGAQQLAGTIVVNQFGQQILLPAQTMGQGGTYQLVLRQPQQTQQVLIQSPQSNQNIAGKQQFTRFMSPIQNQTVQLQPIQTANGQITYAIVGRYNPQQAQQTITTNSQQLITTTEAPMIQSKPAENNNLTTTNAFNNNNNNNANSKTNQPQVKFNAPQSNNQILNSFSSGEPPKKKPRPSKSKKKPQAQVTIDLEDILKQSGIMDEDLQDDGLFNFGDEFSTPAVEQSNYEQVEEQQHHMQNSYTNQNEKLNGLLSSSLPVKVLPPVEYKGKKKSSLNKKGTPTKNNSFTPNKNTPISTKKKKNSSTNRTMYENNNNNKSPVSSKSNFNSKKKNPSKPTITSTSSSLDDSIALVAMGVGGKSPEEYKPEIKQEPKTINNQNTISKPSTPITNSNTVSNTTTGGASIQITSGGGRIIQTIQLAQKDQILLRNIQVQITRLLSLTSRNENEQVALQKLIHLQQQVIASGTPVPTNNSHVNFAQSIVGNNAFTIGGMPVDTSTDASGIGAQNKVKVNHQAIFAAVKQESGTTDKKLSSGVVQSNQIVSQQKSAEEKKIDDAVRRAEEENKKKWKKEEFDMILKRDQEAAQNPDYQIPFKSSESAIQRLLKYHIYDDRTTDMNFEEFENGFAETSKHLMDKFQSMSFKFRSLLLKESMKEVACSERVMLERVFVNEEKQKLEQDRLLVNQGEILDLPSPPPSWLPLINDMVDKEISELERDAINSHQVQSAIDSIMSFGTNNESSVTTATEEAEKVELDAFGVPTSSSGYGGDPDRNSIDEAIRSILG